jgi:DNA-binding SARP family transcriptional activator
MDAPWRIELLGWLRAVQDGRVVSRFRTKKTGALLAYLALYRHRSHPREELIELHWPGSDPATGRHNLSIVLSSLRHQLEPPGVPSGAVILADRSAVQLNPVACTTDVTAFETTLQVAARTSSGTKRVQRLMEAVELYRGELLPGYFEEWILPERQRLAEAYLQSLGQLVSLLEHAGDFPRALQFAHRAVSVDPLREEAHRDLMRLLAAAGQLEAALRQYQELKRLLEDAWGVAPEAESLALVRAIGEGYMRRTRQELMMSPPAELLIVSPTYLIPPAPLPTGTVTFLLAEISTAATAGNEAKQVASEISQTWRSHQEELCSLFRGYGGHGLQGTGELLRVAFGRASDALAAAVAAQKAWVGDWREGVGASSDMAEGPSERPPLTAATAVSIRIALHTGEVEPGEEAQNSPSVEYAARLLLAAHPGQILLSEKSAVLLRDHLEPGLQFIDLGL